MAQVLKETLRERILQEARKELLVKGYQGASMRRIAANARMTVGNLYRYYKNKDELIQTIVRPALLRLDHIIQSNSKERVSFYQHTQTLRLSLEEVNLILDQLSKELIALYQNYHTEMMILMLHSEITQQLTQWFADLIEILVKEWLQPKAEMAEEIRLCCRMMAVSIFDGLQEGFRLADFENVEEEKLQRIFRMYFGCYISMLKMQTESGE